MAGGCQTVQALSIRTGAGTVCGGCVPRLAELTAETLSQPVRCLEVIERAHRVRSFRFEMPQRLAAGTIQPGQRLFVGAKVGGVEVVGPIRSPRRPASGAITRSPFSASRMARCRTGCSSNAPGATVAVLPPSGTCFFELADPRPLVCLVGGIGVTPALDICRSAAASGTGRRMHVDYRCRRAIRSFAARNCAAGLPTPEYQRRTRVTCEDGRFQAVDVTALACEFSDADWLICGSKPFQADAQGCCSITGCASACSHRIVHPGRGRIRPNHADLGVVAPATARGGLRTARRGGCVRRAGDHRDQVAVARYAAGGDRLQRVDRQRAARPAALQWHLGYVRWRRRAQETSRAYGFHVALGPAVLGMMWLHSTHLGYGSSMAVSLSFLPSLATGAILGAHPRSSRWEGAGARCWRATSSCRAREPASPSPMASRRCGTDMSQATPSLDRKPIKPAAYVLGAVVVAAESRR